MRVASSSWDWDLSLRKDHGSEQKKRPVNPLDHLIFKFPCVDFLLRESIIPVI